MSSLDAGPRALQEQPIVSRSEFKWDFKSKLTVSLVVVGLLGCAGFYLPILLK